MVKKTTDDDELCDTNFPQLKKALNLNHFTYIGLSQTLNRFNVRKSNRFLVTHQDHTVIRYMDDSPYDTDPTVNSQLPEKVHGQN